MLPIRCITQHLDYPSKARRSLENDLACDLYLIFQRKRRYHDSLDSRRALLHHNPTRSRLNRLASITANLHMYLENTLDLLPSESQLQIWVETIKDHIVSPLYRMQRSFRHCSNQRTILQFEELVGFVLHLCKITNDENIIRKPRLWKRFLNRLVRTRKPETPPPPGDADVDLLLFVAHLFEGIECRDVAASLQCARNHCHEEMLKLMQSEGWISKHDAGSSCWLTLDKTTIALADYLLHMLENGISLSPNDAYRGARENAVEINMSCSKIWKPESDTSLYMRLLRWWLLIHCDRPERRDICLQWLMSNIEMAKTEDEDVEYLLRRSWNGIAEALMATDGIKT
jgi:hypothetical protein